MESSIIYRPLTERQILEKTQIREHLDRLQVEKPGDYNELNFSAHCLVSAHLGNGGDFSTLPLFVASSLALFEPDDADDLPPTQFDVQVFHTMVEAVYNKALAN